MRRPAFDMNEFRERRARLAKNNTGAAFLLPAHPEMVKNNDSFFPYRQDTNLFYLTGFEEPEAILLFRPGQTPESVLFVRPKDLERETWDGFRYGPEAAQREFAIDKTYLVSEFDKVVRDLLKNVDRLYYRWNLDAKFDARVLEILHDVRLASGRSGRGHLPVYDSSEPIGELRLFKSPHDVSMMRKACEISAFSHIEAMKFTHPGVNERQIQGVLAGSFFTQGADREGYTYIIASGANATTLHYGFNDQVCKDGDLLLVDAGAELQFFTGDITRTYPVNGRFTATQTRFYQAVLNVQKAVLSMIKPGIEFRAMQTRTIEMLTEVMIDFGLLKGNKQSLIDTFAFRKYYPHGVSHWLGMDVHDAGLHVLNGEPRRLEAGMAFTVEPGLYVRDDDLSAPQEFRGLGVRIEDNVVVTADGCDNLTAMCPKEIADLEEIIGAGTRD